MTNRLLIGFCLVFLAGCASPAPGDVPLAVAVGVVLLPLSAVYTVYKLERREW